MSIFGVARGGEAVGRGARVEHLGEKARKRSRRGGQGRAVWPARRGSLEGPGREIVASHHGDGTPPAAFLVALGLDTAVTSPLVPKSGRGRPSVRLPDIPSSRGLVHGVFRPQPNGLTQISGHALAGGHTSIFELAFWLCPNLLNRPLGRDSGSRRHVARNR